MKAHLKKKSAHKNKSKNNLAVKTRGVKADDHSRKKPKLQTKTSVVASTAKKPSRALHNPKTSAKKRTSIISPRAKMAPTLRVKKLPIKPSPIDTPKGAVKNTAKTAVKNAVKKTVQSEPQSITQPKTRIDKPVSPKIAKAVTAEAKSSIKNSPTKTKKELKNARPGKKTTQREPLYPNDRVCDPRCHIDCTQLIAETGHCRFHYIRKWAKLQRKRTILNSGQLKGFLQELVEKYPRQFLELIRDDLTSEHSFQVIAKALEFTDEDLKSDSDDEYDEIENFDIKVLGDHEDG